VNFAMEKGEFVCIIGHSGCGKTTILNVLAGLDAASAAP
jgi:nitrate/nitrite transport system ATP-binding protein